MRSEREMLTQAFIDLINSRFGGGHVPQRVQQHEIMDRAVVANGIDADVASFSFRAYASPSSRSGHFPR